MLSCCLGQTPDQVVCHGVVNIVIGIPSLPSFASAGSSDTCVLAYESLVIWKVLARGDIRWARTSTGFALPNCLLASLLGTTDGDAVALLSTVPEGSVRSTLLIVELLACGLSAAVGSIMPCLSFSTITSRKAQTSRSEHDGDPMPSSCGTVSV